jgi:AAA family ATP:ADP antiporter
MSLLLFCVLFNLGVLKSVKDSLVIPAIGAEVISLLKLWVVLPAALIFTFIYVRLSNLLKVEHLFYLITSVFIIIFLLFAYIIYPNQHHYHPDPSTIKNIISIYPNLKWTMKLVGKWSYCIIYIFSELWSSVVINLMFWQIINQHISTQQAKRLYPSLGIVGNFGLICAGSLLIYVGEKYSIPIMKGEDYCADDKIIKILITVVSFSAVVAMCIVKYICSFFEERSLKTQKSKPNSLSLMQSLKLIAKSKYILYIFMIVFCYNFVINIVEGSWKAKVKILYPEQQQYVYFMGQFNLWLGGFCIFFVFIGNALFRFGGWKAAIYFSPILIFITSIIFFILAGSEKEFTMFNSLVGAVVIGSIQNVLSKASKYSIFDASKEMAYIPLDPELKSKGKAAVEVIGGKLGKSSSALLQFMIFIIHPDIGFENILFLLCIVFCIMTLFWLFNTYKLSVEYHKIVN